MEKIKNYIKNGRGLGFLFLMTASVLMTMGIMFALKSVYGQIRPQIMLVADEILPINVQAGKIVSPENVYKRVDINFGESDGKVEIFPVVLDTKSEASDMPKAEMGLFLMRDVAYLIMQDEVRRIQLHDGEINKPLLEEKLDYFLGLSSLIMSVMMVAIIFIFSLIKSLILALLSGIILKAQQASSLFSFEAQMRLCAVVVASIETVCFLFSLVGLPVVWFYQFVIEMVLVSLYVVKESKNLSVKE